MLNFGKKQFGNINSGKWPVIIEACGSPEGSFSTNFYKIKQLQDCLFFQKDLDQVRIYWHIHTIRKTKNSQLPSGKPCNLYYFPERYDAEEQKVEIEDEEDFEVRWLMLTDNKFIYFQYEKIRMHSRIRKIIKFFDVTHKLSITWRHKIWCFYEFWNAP